MHVPVLLAHWLLGLRSLLEITDAEPIEAAAIEIHGASFWQVRDPARPGEPWREARERDAIRYRVLVEQGVELTSAEFVATVDAALGDPGGWAAAGRSFARVDERAEITVLLARPSTVDRLCKPLATIGRYSCGRGGRASLNLARWQRGTSAWTASLVEYRTYMVNHEVGHLLGMPHLDCPASGEPAPIMQQQTFGLDGCLPSAWPSTGEIDRLRRRWGKR
ncbi:DUF3152 domain-containing protein [Nannocystaceae bacterium ST9]